MEINENLGLHCDAVPMFTISAEQLEAFIEGVYEIPISISDCLELYDDCVESWRGVRKEPLEKYQQREIQDWIDEQGQYASHSLLEAVMQDLANRELIREGKWLILIN